MSANDPGYAIQSQVHTAKSDPATGNIVPGYEITVRDNMYGTVFPVFVPDANYGAEQAKTLIEFELGKVRSVHALGS